MSLLSKIQSSLDAPKSQFNKFGKFHFRNVEDINTGLKPLLNKYECSVKTTTEIVMIGNRFYVKATAILKDKTHKVIDDSVGWARETEEKKGMDSSQVTGSAQSYAKKYALCGLFAIDDDKDADTFNGLSDSNKKEVIKTIKSDGNFVVNVGSPNVKDKKVKDISIEQAANTLYFFKKKTHKISKEKYRHHMDDFNAACAKYWGKEKWLLSLELEKKKQEPSST